MKADNNIVRQTRQARDAYAAELGYDLDRIVADLKQKEKRHPQRLVRLSPRRSRPSPHSHGSRAAFTLIELLVVVTIIVVLLALLTPALDKAIYQSELTVCGARLKGIGTAMLTHAMDKNRLYPERRWHGQWIELTAYGALTSATSDIQTGVDNRAPLREYIGVSLNKMLNCPLQKGVDIETPSANTTAIAGGYGLWNDWLAGPSEKGMRRVGDRWTFMGETFRLLAQDYEMQTDTLYATHPDRDNVMTEIVFREQPWGLDGTMKRTIDTWYIWPIGLTRGLMDRNFLYDDGSVIRLLDIRVKDKDERMTTVPFSWGSDYQYPLWWEHLPLN